MAALPHQFLDRAYAARERACEAAIQSGRYGVLERWTMTGVTFEVSARVPYGTIQVER